LLLRVVGHLDRRVGYGTMSSEEEVGDGEGRDKEGSETTLSVAWTRQLAFELQRDGEGMSGAWGRHLKHNWWRIELICQGLARRPFSKLVRRIRDVKRYALKGDFAAPKCSIFGIP